MGKGRKLASRNDASGFDPAVFASAFDHHAPEFGEPDYRLVEDRLERIPDSAILYGYLSVPVRF